MNNIFDQDDDNSDLAKDILEDYFCEDSKENEFNLKPSINENSNTFAFNINNNNFFPQSLPIPNKNPFSF